MANTTLIADPLPGAKLPSDYLKHGWCRRSGAKDSLGYTTSSISPSAVCWCMAGAIGAAVKLSNFANATPLYDVLNRITKPLIPANILKEHEAEWEPFIIWNDNVCCDQATAVKIMEQAEKEIGL